MNQCLKDSVYSMGTPDQVDYIVKAGGMNNEEIKVFQMLHEGKSDEAIQLSLGMSRKYYDRVEAQVSRKLLVAIFHCIDTTMNVEHF